MHFGVFVGSMIYQGREKEMIRDERLCFSCIFYIAVTINVYFTFITQLKRSDALVRMLQRSRTSKEDTTTKTTVVVNIKVGQFFLSSHHHHHHQDQTEKSWKEPRSRKEHFFQVQI